MTRLDEREARTDLTSRECAKIIGSFIGGLCLLADRDTVREAITWWAEQDAVWNTFPKSAIDANRLSRKIAEGEFLR